MGPVLPSMPVQNGEHCHLAHHVSEKALFTIQRFKLGWASTCAIIKTSTWIKKVEGLNLYEGCASLGDIQRQMCRFY